MLLIKEVISKVCWDNGSPRHVIYSIDGDDEIIKHEKFFHHGERSIVEYTKRDGTPHLEGDPAFQSWHFNGAKDIVGFFNDGKLHNEDGPALQMWDSRGNLHSEMFFINGNEIPAEVFLAR